MLADAPPTFTSATALGTGYGGTQLENQPHYYQDMYNYTNASDSELAYPGAIGSGGGFGLHWVAFGSPSAASCCSAW